MEYNTQNQVTKCLGRPDCAFCHGAGWTNGVPCPLYKSMAIPLVVTRAKERPTWGKHFQETYARSVTRVTATAFATAMLFVGIPGYTNDAPPPTIHVSDLVPFAEFVSPDGPATLNFLPSTRKGANSIGGRGGSALVVVFALLNEHKDKGYAMFTTFRCSDHTFAIPTIVNVAVVDGVVKFMDVRETGPHTQSFTPTNEKAEFALENEIPWGVKAEGYACDGVLPKFEPGTQS